MLKLKNFFYKVFKCNRILNTSKLKINYFHNIEKIWDWKRSMVKIYTEPLKFLLQKRKTLNNTDSKLGILILKSEERWVFEIWTLNLGKLKTGKYRQAFKN